MNLTEIMQEVGKWSDENFGEQRYKGDAEKPQHFFLNEAAPLFGVVEEVGELFEAAQDALRGGSSVQKMEEADVVDAIGDIGIYLCDFLYRDQATEFPTPTESEQSLPSIVGELCRTYLKHHQGIRGLGSAEAYSEQRDKLVGRLICVLDGIAIWHTDETFHSCVERTWNEIVKKRNWVADKSSGGGHSH